MNVASVNNLNTECELFVNIVVIGGVFGFKYLNTQKNKDYFYFLKYSTYIIIR